MTALTAGVAGANVMRSSPAEADQAWELEPGGPEEQEAGQWSTGNEGGMGSIPA